MARAEIGFNRFKSPVQRRVALCGAFSESRDHSCDLSGQIRSKNHRPRRRDRALPKTLNPSVLGSIPSGLTSTHPRRFNDLRTPKGTTANGNRTAAAGRRVSSRPFPDRVFWSPDAKVSIEVDKHTADVLRTRAAELGVTVPH